MGSDGSPTMREQCFSSFIPSGIDSSLGTKQTVLMLLASNLGNTFAITSPTSAITTCPLTLTGAETLDVNGESRIAALRKNLPRPTKKWRTRGIVANINGLSAIVKIEAATIKLIVRSDAIPSAIPWAHKINENSPNCETHAPSTKAVSRGHPKAITKKADTVLVITMMINTTLITAKGSSTNTLRSSIKPTDTKNNTAKASCRGKQFLAARCAKLDSRITMPAKNAPKAKLTLKIAPAPYAIPMAIANTHNVKSSRDPAIATRCKIHGKTRRRTINIPATKITKPSIVLESDTTMARGSITPSPCVT